MTFTARCRLLLPAACIAAIALSAGARTASAQSVPDLPVASPKARVEQQVGVTTFSLDYSSPAVNGRQIWGGLVPYGQVWRTGANASTKLHASREFTFGGQTVPAGSYSLFTIPEKAGWTVILNSDVDASSGSYDAKKDVARATVKPETLPASRERLAFIFSDTTDDRTHLDIEWEKLRVRVPLQVKTEAHVAENIQRAVDEAWRPHFASARHLLESGGDLDRALEFVNTSISIKPTWWNHWVKAEILGKKGRKADAMKVAQQAQTLGKGDGAYEGFGKGLVTRTIAGLK